MLTLARPVVLLLASLPLLGWGCSSSGDTSFEPAPGAAGSGGSSEAGAAGQGGLAGSSGSGTGGASGGSGAAGSGGAVMAGAGGASGGAGTSGAAGTSPGGAGGAGPGCVDAGPGKKRLSVVGPEIHDAKGKNVVLRGWNWGEWGYTQPEDAADNAAQGATIVRIPLRWWGVYENQPQDSLPSEKVDARDDAAPGHIEPGHLKALDEMVQRAACAGLWIDLFVDSNCGQASAANGPASYCGTAANGEPRNFANDPESAKRFAEVWEFLVDHYNEQPYIAWYELMPEPQMGCTKKPCDWGAAPALYSPIIDRIRKIDAKTPLLVGADGGYDVVHLDTAYIDKPGLIYTGDFLSFGSSHPEWVMQYVSAFRAKRQVPVFIQQVGVKHSDPDALNRVSTILSTLNGAGVGWTWWTYREKSSKGLGFAPYWYEAQSKTWGSDPVWLAAISAAFPLRRGPSPARRGVEARSLTRRAALRGR